MTKKQLTSHGFALFTILIWGTTFVATKVLLEDMSPIQILVYRFVLGYLALWLLAPKPLKLASPRQELWFAAAGVTGITVYQMMENVALTMTVPGAEPVAVQQYLDDLMIKVLPMGLSWTCYFALKKNINPTTLIMIVMGVGIVLGALGICG